MEIGCTRTRPKRYNTYDSLIDDNPEVQKRVVKKEAQVLQQLALDAMNEEYPPLANLAQEKVIQLRKPRSCEASAAHLQSAERRGCALAPRQLRGLAVANNNL